MAVKPHVVELAAQRAQTRFYVAKAIAISQLCKGHRQILVPTRESSRPHIAAVPRHATAKLAIRQEVQQLGENGSALVHSCRSYHVLATTTWMDPPSIGDLRPWGAPLTTGWPGSSGSP